MGQWEIVRWFAVFVAFWCLLNQAFSVQAEEVQTLPEVEVADSAQNAGVVPEAASEGVIVRQEAQATVSYEPGEILEDVPGLVVTQHSGEGKANQYFLRGVNLDHGTDLAITVNGMLINQRTNAHGQGYADLNFLIPELVSDIAYKKGPYYADEGDFSTVGAVNIDYVTSLDRGIANATVGQDGYRKGLLADSTKMGLGTFLYGLEYEHNDGPWKVSEDFNKYNSVFRYSLAEGQDSFNLTAMAYTCAGYATNQIPQRAVESGLISRLGAIDPTDSVASSRASLSGSWQRATGNSMTKANLYVIGSTLDLFSDFTYFLNDPVHGDQFNQTDKRVTAAGNLAHTWLMDLWGLQASNTVGVEGQNDVIDVGLNQTEDRHLLSIVRSDHVLETSGAAYFENSVKWLDKFRTVEGVRTDFYRFDVNSDNPANSGVVYDHITNPKLSLIFGPWEKTEYFINAGGGFHSNDARGTTIAVTPGSGPDSNLPTEKVTPLVRTEGYEVGARTSLIPGLQSSLTLYELRFGSELIFDGDSGTTYPGPPSRRIGFEFTNAYAPTPWLTIGLDFADVEARLTRPDPNGGPGLHIPGAVEGVGELSMAVNNLGPFFGSLQLRYQGPYPLVDDNTVRAPSTTLLNGKVGYKVRKDFAVTLEGINLLNSKVSNIEYYYASRLPGEPAAGVNDVHFHPVAPLSFRLGFTYYL